MPSANAGVVLETKGEKIAEIRTSGTQQFDGPAVRLRQPVHPVQAEQQPAGAAGPGEAVGTGALADPGVATVTAVAAQHGVAALTPVTAGGVIFAGAASTASPARTDQPGVGA